MIEFKKAMNIYQTTALKAGLHSDSQFMAAWASNPNKWKHIFALRMKALELMPSVC